MGSVSSNKEKADASGSSSNFSIREKEIEVLESTNSTSTNEQCTYEEKIPFTEYEMKCLKKGIKRFGSNRWLDILNYRHYCFHALRTSESLKLRAEALNLVKDSRY